MKQENIQENKMATEDKNKITTEANGSSDSVFTTSAPTQIKKPKKKLDKGLLTLFILVGVIFVGYGGYRYFTQSNVEHYEYKGVSYTTPPVMQSKAITTNKRNNVVTSEVYSQDVFLKSGTVSITIQTDDKNKNYTKSSFKNDYQALNRSLASSGVTWAQGTEGSRDTDDTWSHSNTGILLDTNTWVSYRIYYDKKLNRTITIKFQAPMTAAEEAAQIMATLKYNNK